MINPASRTQQCLAEQTLVGDSAHSFAGCHRRREHVAAAPHRLDEFRVAGIALEFLAQAAHLRVDAAVEPLAAVRPRARSSSWSRLSTRCGRSTIAISRSYSPVLSGTVTPSSRKSSRAPVSKFQRSNR